MKKTTGSGLKGIDTVMANLNKEIKKMDQKALKSIIRIIILVRRDMEKTSPLTPIDLGNLRASFFSITTGGETSFSEDGFKGESAAEMAKDHATSKSSASATVSTKKIPYGVFGFSANYATWVHENVDATFQRPGAGAKFLEKAIKRNKDNFIKILKEGMKVDE